MTRTLCDVAELVRSKNAGPFWVTVALFFNGPDLLRRYRDTRSLDSGLFQRLFGANPAQVKRIPVDSLNMIKISYPRPHPQGWKDERDMHSGQLFARLLDVDIE